MLNARSRSHFRSPLFSQPKAKLSRNIWTSSRYRLFLTSALSKHKRGISVRDAFFPANCKCLCGLGAGRLVKKSQELHSIKQTHTQEGRRFTTHRQDGYRIDCSVRACFPEGMSSEMKERTRNCEGDRDIYHIFFEEIQLCQDQDHIDVQRSRHSSN